MRIISGRLGGRKIHFPSKSWPVRPTTDFAREALFNVLDNRLNYETVSALELFGGTGIHSIELASRGCMDITYVDRHGPSVRFLSGLVKEWELPIVVVKKEAYAFMAEASRKWDYVFADPPYDLKDLPEFPSRVRAANILEADGFFVLEHSSKFTFSADPDFREARNYGQSVFSFFGPAS